MNKRVAIICPTKALDIFSTDTHLVLSQYYKAIPAYREFYLKRRASSQDFIMLDNGAAELKASVEGLSVLDIACELKPNVVVAPDIIYRKEATLLGTKAFLDAHYKELKSLGIKIMGVPQGDNIPEWLECYREFNKDSRISWLGISMFYTPKFGKRVEILKAIKATVKKPCHLLGLWNNPYDLLEERCYDFVKSVDTAKPVEFAMEGLSLPGWNSHKHIEDDWYFHTASGVEGLQGENITAKVVANVRDFLQLFIEGRAALPKK